VTDRAALITGASSGIGLEIARVLGREGYAQTIAARRPDKLEAAAETLRSEGLTVHAVAARLQEDDEITRVVAEHRDAFGQLDVLVNNAGVGVGQPLADITTKHLDLQLGVNLRSPILFHREAIGLLREAAARHRNALIVNTASITGIYGEPVLSVYAATKAAMINWTESMHRELSAEGIKSTALCPGFVDTPMTDFVKEQVAADTMLRSTDVAEAVRFLLRVSPACCVPQIQLVRSGERMM
jgi:NAD(P)-dependent dehydrogenase (short-subunit alcohol dehydrogenase family)